MRIRSIPSLLLALCILCVPALAQEPQTLTLRLLTPPSAKEPAALAMRQAGLARIAARIGGAGAAVRIEWKSDEAAAAPEILASLQAASADFAVYDAAAIGDRLALWRFSHHAPFNGLEPAAMVAVLRATIDRAPELRQLFLGDDQVLLAVAPAADFVLASTFPIETIADLAGKSVGVSDLTAHWLPAKGPKPVFGTVSEHLAALAAGNLDAVVMRLGEFGGAGKLPAGLRVTDPGFGAFANYVIAANKQRWDALPASLRGAVRSALGEFEADWTGLIAQASGELRRKIEAGGAPVVRLPLAARRSWAAALGPVARTWAEEVGKGGQPGKQIMDAYLDRLQAAAAPLRDWRK